MELVVTKIIVLTLLGVLRLFFGLVPLKIVKHLKVWGEEGGNRRHQVDAATTLCLCFGGGVLLATCFLHMIPEVRGSLTSARRAGLHDIPQDNVFPLAEMLICSGFFLVFLLEEVVHFLIHRSHVADSTSATTSSDSNGHAESTSSVLTVKVAPATSHAHLVSSPTPSKRHDAQETPPTVANLRNLMVVVALSLHSVFEGLAIGVQQTEQDVWYLFAAVGIHAAAILFCIGLEMATSGAKLFHIVVHMVVLALVSPLGVGIGVVVSVETPETPVQTLVIAVLQGVAGGTILYVTFFEVLDREKKKGTCSGLVRLLFIIIGFSAMASLQLLAGHGHTADQLPIHTSNITANEPHSHSHNT